MDCGCLSGGHFRSLPLFQIESSLRLQRQLTPLPAPDLRGPEDSSKQASLAFAIPHGVRVDQRQVCFSAFNGVHANQGMPSQIKSWTQCRRLMLDAFKLSRLRAVLDSPYLWCRTLFAAFMMWRAPLWQAPLAVMLAVRAAALTGLTDFQTGKITLYVSCFVSSCSLHLSSWKRSIPPSRRSHHAELGGSTLHSADASGPLTTTLIAAGWCTRWHESQPAELWHS